MDKYTPVHIEATTIEDAWFALLWRMMDEWDNDRCMVYEIDRGSFEGHKRLEFYHASILMKNPQARPLHIQFPPGIGADPPCTAEYINAYIPYIMSANKEKDESYTYGERLNAGEVFERCSTPGFHSIINSHRVNQVEHLIEILKKSPGTNQAVLQVAQPSDILLDDPPCLRHIDVRVYDNKLIFFPYFRSWDLWGGFPVNIAGIVHLQEYMADCIGVEPGYIHATSKGLHIYDHHLEWAKERLGRTDERSL